MLNTTLLHQLITASAERAPDALPSPPARQAQLPRELTNRSPARLGPDRPSVWIGRAGRHLPRQTRRDRRRQLLPRGRAACSCRSTPSSSPSRSAILRDCNARVLVTSPERLPCSETLAHCHDLRHVILTARSPNPSSCPAPACVQWPTCWPRRRAGHRVIDNDMALVHPVPSGSTGRPKGVVLSHRNMVAGAKSVASYLNNPTTPCWPRCPCPSTPVSPSSPPPSTAAPGSCCSTTCCPRTC